MGGGYRNGEVPDSWLITFASGWNSADGAWTHSLPPSTYRKHLALVALAKRNTGRALQIGVGWCAYRPLAPQIMLKKRYGIMAATPGTSSHGGFWENQQVMAIDYSNWSYVYNGDRDAWYRDCRACGFVPDQISPRRGYPDEPWHVIDYDPWAAVPAGWTPGNEEDDMPTMEEFLNTAAYTGGPTISQFFKNVDQGGVATQVWARTVDRGTDGKIPALQELADTKTILMQMRASQAGLESALTALANAKGLDPAAILKAAQTGVENALRNVTFSADIG